MIVKKKVLWQLCGDGNIGPLYAVSQHKNATTPPNNIHVLGQIPAITSCPSAVDLLRRCCIAGRREAICEDLGKWFVQLRNVTEVLGVVGLFFCSCVLVGAGLSFSQGCCSSHPQCWGTTVRQRKAEDLVFPSDVSFLVVSLYSLIPSSTIILGVKEEGRSWKGNAEAVLDKCCQINPSLSKLFPWTFSLCLCSWHKVAKAYDSLSSQWLCVQCLYVSIEMNKVGLHISYWDLGFLQIWNPVAVFHWMEINPWTLKSSEVKLPQWLWYGWFFFKPLGLGIASWQPASPGCCCFYPCWRIRQLADGLQCMVFVWVTWHRPECKEIAVLILSHVCVAAVQGWAMHRHVKASIPFLLNIIVPQTGVMVLPPSWSSHHCSLKPVT